MQNFAMRKYSYRFFGLLLIILGLTGIVFTCWIALNDPVFRLPILLSKETGP